MGRLIAIACYYSHCCSYVLFVFSVPASGPFWKSWWSWLGGGVEHYSWKILWKRPGLHVNPLEKAQWQSFMPKDGYTLNVNCTNTEKLSLNKVPMLSSQALSISSAHTPIFFNPGGLSLSRGSWELYRWVMDTENQSGWVSWSQSEGKWPSKGVGRVSLCLQPPH